MTISIIDTGPIVAFLNKKDSFHHWANNALSKVPVPALTTEPVMSEVCFLLRNIDGGALTALELLKRKILTIGLTLNDEITTIAKLYKKYSSTPMSLADASLVRLSEMHKKSQIITLDKDFEIYRRNGKEVIPILRPKK